MVQIKGKLDLKLFPFKEKYCSAAHATTFSCIIEYLRLFMDINCNSSANEFPVVVVLPHLLDYLGHARYRILGHYNYLHHKGSQGYYDYLSLLQAKKEEKK